MSSTSVIEIIKASFGWGVLLLLAWLAWHILHGEITQANSYGLDAIVGGLLAMAGGYTQWAFGSRVSLHPDSPSEVRVLPTAPLMPPAVPVVPPVKK